MKTLATESKCKGCGSTKSYPLLDENNKKVYWFGAMKGTKDFGILNSSLEMSFLCTKKPKFPSNHMHKYDFYCSKCFDYILKMQERLKQQKEYE